MADGDQGFALDEQAAKRAFDAHAARQLWAAVPPSSASLSAPPNS